MKRSSLMEGAAAFGRGRSRSTNPHDASTEDWLCWRDGWEQAKAAAARLVDVDPIESLRAAT